MAKKKHRKKHPNRPIILKRGARLKKARQWLPTYEGTEVVKDYRERFTVDVNCAVKELLELGYEFEPGYVDSLLQSEALRVERLHAKKEERRQFEYEMPDQDDTFFYIAGYTSGGAPYGVTWEQMARDRVRQVRKQLPPTPILFSDLDEKDRAEAIDRLEELIDDYFQGADYLPTDEDRNDILNGLCDELTESLDEWVADPYDLSDWNDRDDDDDESGDIDDDRPEIIPFKEIIPDNGLISVFNSIVSQINEEYKAEGIELPTYLDTLLIAKTERLKIRRFYKKDFGPLQTIMKKPEVMYAWEAGFSKGETRKWLNRQLTSYHKNGFGYYAVTLKDSDALIGQVGLIKSEINGETVIEIGSMRQPAPVLSLPLISSALNGCTRQYARKTCRL